MNDTSGAQQRDSDGRLRHLLTLAGVSREELSQLLDLAQFYVRLPGDVPARDQHGEDPKGNQDSSLHQAPPFAAEPGAAMVCVGAVARPVLWSVRSFST